MNANGKKMGKRWENMGKDGGVCVRGGVCECG